MIVLDRSSFYPTSGGQEHDTGTLEILGKTYNVLSVEKVGRVNMHKIDRELDIDLSEKEVRVKGEVNEARRKQLRNHHTAAHILFTVARKVIGPHVWQAGAKKTMDRASLDITHYKSLTKEQELRLQDEANAIVMNSYPISKTLEPKAEMEKEHGFNLYQGGVVPGNELRIVKIGEDVDTEACCGTHCDSTSEVGWIKVLSSKTIANGVVRIYFVAGERSMQELNRETMIIHDLMDLWGIQADKITDTATRFFKDFKKYKSSFAEAQKETLSFQIELAIATKKSYIYTSKEPNATLYFSFFPEHAKALKEAEASVGFVGKNFLVLFSPKKNGIDTEVLKSALKETGAKVKVGNKLGKKKKQVKDIQFITVISKENLPDLSQNLSELGFEIRA